jgi:hypothetical protein
MTRFNCDFSTSLADFALQLINGQHFVYVNVKIKIFVLFQKNDKTWTDNQWAFVILVGFTVFALCVAVIMQQIIAWGIISS